MRTPRKASPFVVLTVLALGVGGLTGCGRAASPSGATVAKTTKPTSASPTAAPTTKAPATASVPVAGYAAADVSKAARFAEQFALAAMSGCGRLSVRGLQHLMTAEMYKAALKNPPSWTVLALNPPMVMSQGCVTSQVLSDGQVSRGDTEEGMPTLRVAVTVTEGLKVGTTTDPKTLRPVTVVRRYTVDVLPNGPEWIATNLETSDTTLTEGR